MTKTQKIFLFLLFGIACYFPLFLRLDFIGLELWDEARRGVNALEMLINGNWLVTHYDGQPEMWGTKPPFLIWCQVLCMKTLGVNELAIRLPSALAALATVAVLIVFSYRVLKKPLIGVFASLVLLTSKGYIATHVTRSGDFDALLTLWQNSYLLLFFCYYLLPVSKRKTKFLYLTACFVALASFTKGVAGFFFIPGIFIFVIVEKQLISILKSKHTWFAIAGVLTFILGFYLLRNAYNPGYIEQVFQNELGGRYLETQGGHNQPFYYYAALWFVKHPLFAPFIFLVPLGIFIGWNGDLKARKLTQLLIINSIIFLIIVSCAQTKIRWYQAPVYPAFALLVGIGLERLFQGVLFNQTGSWTWKKICFLLLFTIGIFGYPYYQIVQHVYSPKHAPWDSSKLHFRDFMRQQKQVKNYTIVTKTYNSHATFYRKSYNLKGYNINSVPLTDFQKNTHQFGKGNLKFAVGDTLMMCENKVKKQFREHYDFKIIGQSKVCELTVIKGIKRDGNKSSK